MQTLKSTWNRFWYMAWICGSLWCVFDKSLSVGGQIFFLLSFIFACLYYPIMYWMDVLIQKNKLITEAYTEITKIIGYNIEFEKRLETETDPTQIEYIKKSIEQNDLWIAQKESFANSLK